MRLLSQAFRRNSTRVQLCLDVLEDRCLLSSVPFTIGGAPFVDPHDFRITTFATGLNFPYSMVQLSDGSLLLATSRPAEGNLFDSTGELLRLVDADHDGVADGPGTVLFSGLPGVLTAIRQAGNLFFVTSSAGGERADRGPAVRRDACRSLVLAGQHQLRLSRRLGAHHV
jgi:hypothetical protein